MGLAVIAVDSIPLLGLAEVMPVVMSERDPQVPASQSHDVAAGRGPPRPPMEGTTSAQRQPKLVVTQRPVTMPTHARPPGTHTISLWSRCPAPMANRQRLRQADDTSISDSVNVVASDWLVADNRRVRSGLIRGGM